MSSRRVLSSPAWESSSCPRKFTLRGWLTPCVPPVPVSRGKQSYVRCRAPQSSGGHRKRMVEALTASVDRKAYPFSWGEAGLLCIRFHARRHCRRRLGLRPLSLIPRTGLIAGKRRGILRSTSVRAWTCCGEKGIRRVGAFRVPRIMSSTVSANLATAFRILGVELFDYERVCHRARTASGAAY